METTTMKPSHKPPEASTLFKKILVAVDGSESSTRASKVAVDLAEKIGAELVVVHAITPIANYYRSSLASVPGAVAPPPTSQQDIDAYYAYARRVAKEIVGETVATADKHHVKVNTTTPEAVSSVVETIVNQANKDHADLIIVGTRGMGGFKKLLIGSVSSGVISHASCPVLIVR